MESGGNVYFVFLDMVQKKNFYGPKSFELGEKNFYINHIYTIKMSLLFAVLKPKTANSTFFEVHRCCFFSRS